MFELKRFGSGVVLFSSVYVVGARYEFDLVTPI